MKAVKVVEIQAQKELRAAAKKGKEEQLKLQKKSIKPIKTIKSQRKVVKTVITLIVEEEEEEEVLVSFKGRSLQRNRRLRDLIR